MLWVLVEAGRARYWDFGIKAASSLHCAVWAPGLLLAHSLCTACAELCLWAKLCARWFLASGTHGLANNLVPGSRHYLDLQLRPFWALSPTPTRLPGLGPCVWDLEEAAHGSQASAYTDPLDPCCVLGLRQTGPPLSQLPFFIALTLGPRQG